MPSLVARTFGVRGLQRLSRLPIASGQTYKAGDFLALNASGQLIQAVASGANVGAPSGQTNLIVGRATEDAAASPNDVTIIPSTKLYGEFIVAEPGTQFELPLYNSSVPTNAYPAKTQLSVAYELRNAVFPSAAGGVTCYAVDLFSTTNVKFIVVDFLPDTFPLWPDVGQTADPTTGTLSQYASAWVEFIVSACALSGARPIARS